MNNNKPAEYQAKPMNRAGFGKRNAIRMMVEKPKNFQATVKILWSYLTPFKLRLAAAMFLAVGSTVFSILGPKILGRATTEVYNGLMAKITQTSGGGIDFTLILDIVLLLLALYIVSALFSFFRGYIMAGIAQQVAFTMRRSISEKINRLPLKYFDTQSHGDILARVTSDVDTVNNSLNQSLSQIITAVTTILGVLVMMFTISWLMTLVSLLILPISIFSVTWVTRRSQKHFAAQQAGIGRVNGHAEEMYSAYTIIKAFNGEEKSAELFDRYNDTLYDSAWKAQFLSGMMMPVMNFVGNISYVAVAILGGWLAMQKIITVGDIQAFVQYVRLFTQPLSQTAQIAGVLQSTVAAAERIFEFLAEAEEPLDKLVLPTEQPFAGEVVFEAVNFAYQVDKPVIHNFSALINPGQRVAVVGPTGAGKTTIIKLLLRFYETDGGIIRLDGCDLRDFARDELRAMFGMVLQDTWLSNGTIMDNIRYGNLQASDEQVIAAAQAAYADPFIRALPNGYRLILNEEANNLSAGQKQLITIARAFLADPKILILDEATSSVDTRTEALIQKAMEHLMAGRTCFIIAHRLSTIRNADLILVMDHGDIAEQGTHEELLAKKGLYAELYNSQFEQVS